MDKKKTTPPPKQTRLKKLTLDRETLRLVSGGSTGASTVIPSKYPAC